MCLYVIKERLAGRGTKSHIGWKVFDKYLDFKSDFPYGFRYYPNENSMVVPVNRWLKATNVSIGSIMGTGPRYDSGFHIYTNRYVAEGNAQFWDHLVVAKVRYRGIVAKGKEASMQVVVAKEMYVPYRKSGRTRNVNKKKK